MLGEDLTYLVHKMVLRAGKSDRYKHINENKQDENSKNQ